MPSSLFLPLFVYPFAHLCMYPPHPLSHSPKCSRRLCLFMYPSNYLSVPVHLFISPSFQLSTNLYTLIQSVPSYIHLSICSSIHPSVISISISSSVYLYTCPSPQSATSPPNCPSFYQFGYPSVYLSLYLYVYLMDSS